MSDSTHLEVIEWTGALALDITTSGAGGLDTGAEAASTWYYVFVIRDLSGALPVAALLSASSTDPTLPAGYDVFRRVGSARNDASSNLIPFFACGTRQRCYSYTDVYTGRQILVGGGAVALTVVSAAAFVPPTSRSVNLTAEENNASRLGYIGDGGAVAIDAVNGAESLFGQPTDASQNLSYGHDGAGGSLDLYVRGYREDL